MGKCRGHVIYNKGWKLECKSVQRRWSLLYVVLVRKKIIVDFLLKFGKVRNQPIKGKELG